LNKNLEITHREFLQSLSNQIFKAFFTFRMKFSKWTSLTQRSDIFGSLLNEPGPIRFGEFEVANLSAVPLFILPFGKITANESAERPEMMRSIIRFEIRFRRAIYYYLLTVALPLFCLATITFMAATVTDASSSLLWLLLCTAAQILNYTQMLSRIPPDQQNTPFCAQGNSIPARMATVVFAETFILIMYRAALSYTYAHSANDRAFLGCASVQQIETVVRILLFFHVILNGILLFS
uniref:Neur_chan_memb domain-containing protein n=1 Tax=Gongylonema pulchrum TaxID=637853 RepID=A0A183CV15_9BILA